MSRVLDLFYEKGYGWKEFKKYLKASSNTWRDLRFLWSTIYYNYFCDLNVTILLKTVEIMLSLKYFLIFCEMESQERALSFQIISSCWSFQIPCKNIQGTLFKKMHCVLIATEYVFHWETEFTISLNDFSLLCSKRCCHVEL